MDLKKFKNFSENRLLFCRNIVEYTCKSNEGTPQKDLRKKIAHHFPPYHIGSPPDAARYRGGYRYNSIPNNRAAEVFRRPISDLKA